MPELPEVETIKRDIEITVKGKEISAVEVLWKGAINISGRKFSEMIKNAKILNISRRAKMLILTLSNGCSLLIHLKMTGQLIYDPGFAIYDLQEKLLDSKYKYARIIFFFKAGGAMVFNDLRKFGYIKIIPQNIINDFVSNEKFGPEPLEKKFTSEIFEQILKKYPKRKIKQLLMEQEIIAGIGNIYADEICFYAKIAPVRQAGNLSKNEIKLIFEGIKKILNRAIKLRGSSVENYVDANGKKGDYARELKVYNREEKKCLRCKKGVIKRIKIGARSAHYCPNCQK